MPLTTDQTPAETSAAQGSADYDGVEAICEISHELAEAFEKHERLQADLAAMDTRTLPDHASLDEAEAAALNNSIIAKELQKEKKKQDEELNSLSQDLSDWQTRVEAPGAFPRNEIAKHLVQSSLTAAVNLIREQQKYLTDAHRKILSNLGATSDDELLLAASRSPSSFKITSDLDAEIEDFVVQQHLSNLRSHESTVIYAREALGISLDDGDVLAAIDKLKSDLFASRSTTTTLPNTKSSNETLQQVLDKIKSHIEITFDNNDVAYTVDKVCSHLDIAKSDQATLEDIRKVLGIDNILGKYVLDYVRNVKKRSRKLADVVREARIQLDVTGSDDAVAEIVSRCIKTAIVGEASLSRARSLLALDPVDGNIPSAISSLKRQAFNAEHDKDFVRKTFAFSHLTPFRFGVINIKTRLELANQGLKTLRKLLVPGTELVEGTGNLNRYKPLGYQIVDNGEPLEAPTWSLAMADVPTTKEHFTQLTERLRALMVLDGDVLYRLEVLEGLIQQVDQCTRQDLDTLLDMLYVCWKSDGHIEFWEENVMVVPDSTPQTALQALFEARLLELLVRGTATLHLGWTDSRNAVVDVWCQVNQTVINTSAMLEAYNCWFQGFGQPTSPINLLEDVFNIARTSHLSPFCQERRGLRVLIADVVADGSHCFLWQPDQLHGSLHAVAELRYHIPTNAVVFPVRQGGIATDAPFVEPIPPVFIRNNMESVRGRGFITDIESL